MSAIAEVDNVSIQSRVSLMLNFMWDTTGFALGSYTISAYVTPVAGEMSTADNSFVGNAIQIIQATSGGGGKMPYIN